MIREKILDVDKVMEDRSTFDEAITLYRKMFDKDLPSKFKDITPEQIERMFKFVTGYKIGREIGTKIGEKNDATIMFI